MAWTSVPDKASGDVLTEANWDTHIRDNLNTGVPVMLADTTLGASAASISFASITQTFTHLMVVAYLRGDTAATSTTMLMRFNADTGANYDEQVLLGTAATTTPAEAFASTSISVGSVAANTAGANLFSGAIITIPYYSQASNNKNTLTQQAHKIGTATGNLTCGMKAAFWRSNSAITSITLLPAAGNFVSGARATLYGLP